MCWKSCLKSMSNPILIEELLGHLGYGSKAHDSEGVLLVGSNRSLSQDVINRGRYAWHWILNCFTLLLTLKLKKHLKGQQLAWSSSELCLKSACPNLKTECKKCPKNNNRNKYSNICKGKKYSPSHFTEHLNFQDLHVSGQFYGQGKSLSYSYPARAFKVIPPYALIIFQYIIMWMSIFSFWQLLFLYQTSNTLKVLACYSTYGN